VGTIVTLKTKAMFSEQHHGGKRSWDNSILVVLHLRIGPKLPVKSRTQSVHKLYKGGFESNKSHLRNLKVAFVTRRHRKVCEAEMK
jgi:hypothetical protein